MSRPQFLLMLAGLLSPLAATARSPTKDSISKDCPWRNGTGHTISVGRGVVTIDGVVRFDQREHYARREGEYSPLPDKPYSKELARDLEFCGAKAAVESYKTWASARRSLPFFLATIPLGGGLPAVWFAIEIPTQRKKFQDALEASFVGVEADYRRRVEEARRAAQARFQRSYERSSSGSGWDFVGDVADWVVGHFEEVMVVGVGIYVASSDDPIPQAIRTCGAREGGSWIMEQLASGADAPAAAVHMASAVGSFMVESHQKGTVDPDDLLGAMKDEGLLAAAAEGGDDAELSAKLGLFADCVASELK